MTYDGTFGIRQATNLIEPLNAEQQIEMRKISHQNAGLSLPVGWDVTKNPWIGTTRTDWMDEIFRTAFYQRHNVALNVGSDNFSNRISFAYDNDEGVLINTFKKNLTLRYNGKMQLNKWVSVSEDFVWQNTYLKVLQSEDFKREYDQLLRDYVGRPSPLYLAHRLSEKYGCRIYLKREDLNHTGAHKINNSIGQVLLARRMGKRRIIAETG